VDGFFKVLPIAGEVRFAASRNKDGSPLGRIAQCQLGTGSHLFESLHRKVRPNAVLTAFAILPEFENKGASWRSIIATSVGNPIQTQRARDTRQVGVMANQEEHPVCGLA
jgi:hypothetical protein